jgi:alanine racemase
MPRAWLEIDLTALEKNVALLKQHTKNSELMAVVKANAYGHGLVECAKASLRGGAQWLAVAVPREAIMLREHEITSPILSWLIDIDDDFEELIDNSIDIGVSSDLQLNKIAEAAKIIGKAARIHVKIDTGLGRNGSTLSDLTSLLSLCKKFEKLNLLKVVGVMSHLASADEPNNPSIATQLTNFTHAIDLMRAEGLEPETRHLANSAASLALPETYLNVVRPGLGIYGIFPNIELQAQSQIPLKPVMKLKAKVAMVKEVPAGQGVSYAHQYVTKSSTKLALIPLGYADGIPRAASNIGPVMIGNQVFTISGRVCMDQFVVDVGDAQVSAGDTAILFGDPELGEPSVNDWADAANTINYEILTRMSPLLPRIFVRDS